MRDIQCSLLYTIMLEKVIPEPRSSLTLMGESTLMRDEQILIYLPNKSFLYMLLLFSNLLIAMYYFSYLYQIAHLGDEDDEPEFSSAMPLEEGDTFFFAPRPLRNLVLVDELDSLSPILGKE